MAKFTIQPHAECDLPLPSVDPSDPEPAILAASPPLPAFTIPSHWVDREGNPIRYYPARYQRGPEAWYEDLQKLRPAQCGWPDGGTLSQDNARICRRLKVEGGARCSRHTGSRGRGLVRMAVEGNSGAFSRYLPKEYWKIYKQVKEDPKLLEIRQDVELIAIRQAELVKQLHSGESGSLWKALKEAWKEFQAARGKQDADKMGAALAEVGRLIAEANKKEHLWRDLGNWTDRLVTLKRAEHQRLKELHEMLTVERFLTVLAAYHEVVLDVTPERDRRLRLARRLQAIIESGGAGTRCRGDGESGDGEEAEVDSEIVEGADAEGTAVVDAGD